jgi:hypothetical protein
LKIHNEHQQTTKSQKQPIFRRDQIPENKQRSSTTNIADHGDAISERQASKAVRGHWEDGFRFGAWKVKEDLFIHEAGGNWSGRYSATVLMLVGYLPKSK